MEGALDGIKIVEWGAFHAGVAAGYMMGDMGAQVIKVEEPGKGDPVRGMSSLYGQALGLPGGRTIQIEITSRNKRSITLDLKQPKGREVFYRLIKDADVFISNYRANVLSEAGVDYESLKKVNPRIVYAWATALGSRGPEGNRRGFDSMGGARSGLMWAAGDRDHDEPFQNVAMVYDQITAIEAGFGILAALIRRDRTGKGQMLEVSLLGSSIHLEAMMIGARSFTGRAMSRHSRKRARNVLSNHFRCRDGRWIIFMEPQSDRYWSSFCTAIGRPDLIADPRFDTSLKRRDTYEQLIPIMDQVFASRDRAEWLRIFEENHCEFAYSQVSDYDDVMKDPQVFANKYIVDFDHPALGKVQVPGFPIAFSDTPCAIQREGPELGQHTEEVLLEHGLSWEEIAQLREQHII